MRAVHGAVVQVQRVRAAQFGQQGGVQARPDTCLGPVPQPTPGRDSEASHGPGRNVAPGDAGPQDVHDAGENRSVRKAKPPWMPAAPPGALPGIPRGGRADRLRPGHTRRRRPTGRHRRGARRGVHRHPGPYATTGSEPFRGGRTGGDLPFDDSSRRRQAKPCRCRLGRPPAARWRAIPQRASPVAVSAEHAKSALTQIGQGILMLAVCQRWYP